MTDQQNDHMDELDEGVPISLKWGDTSELSTIYTNQMYITHGGKEFYLVFGEVSLPFYIGEDEEALPELLVVKPLVRLAISPEAMVDFANAINQNVSKFLRRQQVTRSTEDGDE